MFHSQSLKSSTPGFEVLYFFMLSSAEQETLKIKKVSNFACVFLLLLLLFLNIYKQYKLYSQLSD